MQLCPKCIIISGSFCNMYKTGAIFYLVANFPTDVPESAATFVFYMGVIIRTGIMDKLGQLAIMK